MKSTDRAAAFLDLLAWTRRVLEALRQDRRGDPHVAGTLRAVLQALDPASNPRLARALPKTKAVKARDGAP